jgi:hypothetical protein
MTASAGYKNNKKKENNAICEIRIIPGILTAILAISVLIIFAGITRTQQAQAAVLSSITSLSCNCVVFRLDDIQNFWLHDVQLATLSAFSDSDTKVTPGLIMNFYGADAPIVAKIQEGKEAGIYELALHGWNHVDYSKLPLAEQEQTLTDANTKLQSLHGSKSNIFIAPYNSLNENTLIAMKDAGLEIVSADAAPDNGFLAPTYAASSSSSSSSLPASAYNSTDEIKSLPVTVNFMDRHKPAGSNGKTLTQLKNEIDASIASHGWAVIMLHPQDFAVYSNNNNSDGNSGGRIAQNTVNSTQIALLKSLIEQLATDGRTVTSFNGLVDALGDNTHGQAATTTAVIIPPSSPHLSKQARTTSTTTEHLILSDQIAANTLKPSAGTIIDGPGRFAFASLARASPGGEETGHADEVHPKGESAHMQDDSNVISLSDWSLWGIMQSLLSGLINIITATVVFFHLIAG